VLAASAAVVLLCAAAPAAGAASTRHRVVSRAVSFTVQNVNGSKLACATDGAAYTVKGHLTGPSSVLGSRARRRGRAVTLYLHGLGFGEWFWTFKGVRGYDYAAAQAKAGHTSLTIDRLGYDASGHPDGNKVCLGSQADIAHQIVHQLRSGSYTPDSGRAVRFKRVALAGHSAGAQIAMLEAYSFHDVDALVLMSFSYSNLPRAQIALGPTRDTCQAGGEPAEPGLPSGYAYYGQPTATDFISVMFARSTPVATAAVASRNRDPCGDTDSIIHALIQQGAMLPKVKVPVLVICGTKDALYSKVGCDQQKERFTHSRSATLAFVRGAGHALTLEPQAPTFRRKVGRWLSRRGF
jgi:pimeloyl-ACP methyl ester carboxylesterase